MKKGPFALLKWLGKTLSFRKKEPNHWLLWGSTRTGMSESDPIKKNSLCLPQEAEDEEKSSTYG